MEQFEVLITTRYKVGAHQQEDRSYNLPNGLYFSSIEIKSVERCHGFLVILSVTYGVHARCLALAHIEICIYVSTQVQLTQLCLPSTKQQLKTIFIETHATFTQCQLVQRPTW